MEETKTTQAALAKVVGMTRQGIALYTSGQTTPDIETFVKIADYFNVSYDYLLGYSDSRDRENHDIVEETGLSEKAIEKLKTWVEGVNETDANGVQFTRNVNTKAPKELSAIIESKEFRRLMGYIRALKYVSGEDDGTVKNFFLGPAKVAVLKAELGSRSVRDYIIFLALNTFRDILNEIIPHVPSVDRGWRKATQADKEVHAVSSVLEELYEKIGRDFDKKEVAVAGEQAVDANGEIIEGVTVVTRPDKFIVEVE